MVPHTRSTNSVSRSLLYPAEGNEMKMVAEREGFEPSMGLPPNRISNAAP